MKNLICGCSASKKIMFVAVAIILLGSQIASAVTISSPSSSDPTNPFRVFSLTTFDDSNPTEFLASGTGNINGNNDPFNGVDPFKDYIFLDTSDPTDSGAGEVPDSLSGSLISGLTGKFAINSSILTGYTDFALGLKSGNNAYPTWAVFSLNGNTSGDWEITIIENNLSHAILYGKTSTVPVPAAVWLFGSGLIGLVSLRRKSTA